MKIRNLSICVIIATVLAHPALVRADLVEQAFASGHALLAKADFHGALRAFAQAARGDRRNQDYLQHYAMVRQVVTLRERLKTERDPAQWEYIARALHAFYVSQGIYREALALDLRIHARLKSALSAMLLAETQLAMDRNADAAEVLASLEAGKQTVATRSLYGVALARQGKAGEAREVAQKVALAESADPGTLYCGARLHAAVGNTDQALGLLARAFESVAPSRLDGFKSAVKQSPDFARLASTSQFGKVLQTKSKVAESKCSGGSSCAGCPMRAKCPKSQGR